MECALSYSYCNWHGQLSFLTKKERSWSWIKLETSMIFISGIISLIIQKNMLCKNKIRVIYFCQKTFIFIIFFFSLNQQPIIIWSSFFYTCFWKFFTDIYWLLAFRRVIQISSKLLMTSIQFIVLNFVFTKQSWYFYKIIWLAFHMVS